MSLNTHQNKINIESKYLHIVRNITSSYGDIIIYDKCTARILIETFFLFSSKHFVNLSVKFIICIT